MKKFMLCVTLVFIVTVVVAVIYRYYCYSQLPIIKRLPYDVEIEGDKSLPCVLFSLGNENIYLLSVENLQTKHWEHYRIDLNKNEMCMKSILFFPDKDYAKAKVSENAFDPLHGDEGLLCDFEYKDNEIILFMFGPESNTKFYNPKGEIIPLVESKMIYKKKLRIEKK